MTKAFDSSVISFKTAREWQKWLAKNHSRSVGVWLRIAKKNSDEPSVNYAQALDEALCYGWIDSRKQAHDNLSWLQKFSPRKAGSGWSKINTKHAERLTKTGRMKSAGLKEIELAKRDGRWKRAYTSSSSARPPVDFLKELEKNKKAKAFFETLEKRNRYAIIYRLQTAKKVETRAKRMKTILAMLAKGEKFHP